VERRIYRSVKPSTTRTMSRNVEIKARLKDVAVLEAVVMSLAMAGPIDIRQTDTCFNCANGRLKVRKFANGSGELIFYRRANNLGPKESYYLRSETSTPDVLAESLASAYGIVGKVVKHRTLYIIGRTRVHVDRVEDLGNFVELEVVLQDGDTVDGGQREAEEHMKALGIVASDLVETAYVDLVGNSVPSLG
jgi:adenylate cyclase class IV